MKKEKFWQTTCSCILAGILLCTSLSGCSSKEEQPAEIAVIETKTTAVTEKVFMLPEKDMDGWEISVLNEDDDNLTWANIQITVEEINGDILNDAFFERNAILEEKYNAVLTVTESSDPSTMTKNLVIANDPLYDIFACREGGTVRFLPYTMDWNNIPGLSLGEAWWNPNATAVYNMNGKQVALAGNMTLSAVSRAVCMVFNKTIWSSYGNSSVDLYQIVRDGDWTLDKFLEIANSVSLDVNGDGNMGEDDLYGLFPGRGFKGYIASFLSGSEMNFTEADENGNQVFTLGINEKSTALVTRLMDAMQKEGYYYDGKETNLHGVNSSTFFKNGGSLFTQGVPHDIYKLRDMENDIGILPMPKYDAAQKNYCSAAWGGVVWTLSKIFPTEEAENMGIFLEAMSYLTYQDVVPVYKEVALKTKTTRDVESADMLDIIFNTIYFDFGTNIMYDAVIAETVLNELWNKRSSDILVSTVQKYLPIIGAYIEDLNEQLLDFE